MSQESIVTRVYGGAVNYPGGDDVLTRALNNDWTDDNGRRFRMNASIFSAANGVHGVGNDRVIEDLKNDRPLINGSRTHATVVARVDYFATSPAPKVVRVHVIDPWPGAAPGPEHARFLASDEMTAVQRGGSLRFLASVDITAI